MTSDAGLFNVATNLLYLDEYKKKLQESTEPYQYITDLQPVPLCYMSTQNFQGPQIKQSPGSLIDVDTFLKLEPQREAQGSYYLSQNVRNLQPEMPEMLQNRLMIPDCKDLIQARYDRGIRSRDFQGVSGTVRFDVVNERPKQQWIASPGRDTRLEMKDAFRKREEARLAKYFGKGAPDVTPTTDIKCTSGSNELGCMHLFGPDAPMPDDTIIHRYHPAKPASYYIDKLNTGGAVSSQPMPTGQAARQVSSAQIQAAVDQIDPNATLRQLYEEQKVRNGCNTKFYDYVSPCLQR